MNKNINAAAVKQIAKELKIKDWWNKKRAILVTEIAEIKGWSHETEEVIEFLLAGGEIKQLPPGKAKIEKIVKDAPRRKPRKKAKAKKDTPAEDSTTLQDLCEELDIQPRIARRRLRKAKVERPGQTWSWKKGSDEISNIKSIIGG